MPVSTQNESPAICTSCETRSLPEGDGTAAAAGTCAAVAASPKRAWNARGRLAASRQPAHRKSEAFFRKGKRIELSHPAAGVNASSLVTDAWDARTSWMSGSFVWHADSLTDGKCACKLKRCCRVATGTWAPQGMLAKKWEAGPGACPTSDVT